MKNLSFFHFVCLLLIVFFASSCEGGRSIKDQCLHTCNDEYDSDCYKNCVEWAFNPWHIAGTVLAIVGIIVFIGCMTVFKDSFPGCMNNGFCYFIMCPFAALFFAATLVLSVIWCLLCCWCPFCPEFLQHPRKWFFKTKRKFALDLNIH